MVKPLFWLFALTVALAPLPFGGNQPWAWSAIALTLGAIACLWGFAAVFDRTLISSSTRLSLPYAAAFLVLALWLALQAGHLLPRSLQHPAWQEMREALGVDVAGALALAPDRAWTALMRLMSYAAAFWLALHLLRRRGLADRFLWLLVAAGVAYAVYGLVVHLGDLKEVLWIDKYTYWESLTGTFINRNSYAAYAGIGLVVTVGLLLQQLRQTKQPAHLGWRGRLVHFLDHLGFGVWVLIAAFYTSGGSSEKWATTSASSVRACEKFQVRILFTAKPAISTNPVSPRMDSDPSVSLGRAAVVASITPMAPFSKVTIAAPVSSASMSTSAVRALAITETGLPKNHCNRSM